MEQVIDLEEEKREILRRYRKLLRSAKPLLKEGDTKVIKKAFNTAAEAHKDMRRKSGEPYIYHPIAVAQICVDEIGLGTTSIVAALLHDVVEDTATTNADIEKNFGKKVARIIDGLTKISGVFEQGSSQQAENFRKMVVTLSEDVRVILIKLADRLHNMRTLESMPRHKQLKISSETIYIYAPLAHRLGLYAIKSELEDLYLKYTDRDAYYDIARKINETKVSRNKFIREFITPIQKELQRIYLEFKIKGRPKSIYSIWNKMKKQNIPFEEVYDLFAIRVIIKCPVEEEKSMSWKVYSIVTDFYKPNPDRLRDWISTPKANGYESLHTTVMSNSGRWVEVQIRTERMDDIAEKGYAAHWKYKDKVSGPNHNSASTLDQWVDKVRDMLHQNDTNALDFMDTFRSNLYNEEIFVFTPKGDLKIMPQGSTALDFAFEIHTQIGVHCLGAKINHKLVPISHKLKNGDQLEIITSNKQSPTEDWQRFVYTSKAKKKIKEYLNDKRKDISKKGEDLLTRRFKQLDIEMNDATKNRLMHHFKVNDFSELLYQVGEGNVNIKDINRIKDIEVPEKKIKPTATEKEELARIKEINANTLVIGDDVQGLQYSLAVCCKPIPGDEIFGFVTVDQGVKVHRTTCPNATELMSNYGYRIVRASWKKKSESKFLAGIRIKGTDRLGLIHDITNVIAHHQKVNIKSISADTRDGIVEDVIMFFVRDKSHLDAIVEDLLKINDILSIERIDSDGN